MGYKVTNRFQYPMFESDMRPCVADKFWLPDFGRKRGPRISAIAKASLLLIGDVVTTVDGISRTISANDRKLLRLRDSTGFWFSYLKLLTIDKK